MSRQTRLGAALRALKIEDEGLRAKADRVALTLDRTVLCLGTKGEGVKMLAAYGAAKRLYEEITRTAYVQSKS